MINSIVAIVSGAGLGALLRWFLGLKLNPLYTSIPLGTLGANIIGGYLIGVAIAFFLLILQYLRNGNYLSLLVF